MKFFRIYLAKSMTHFSLENQFKVKDVCQCYRCAHSNCANVIPFNTNVANFYEQFTNYCIQYIVELMVYHRLYCSYRYCHGNGKFPRFKNIWVLHGAAINRGLTQSNVIIWYVISYQETWELRSKKAMVYQLMDWCV